MVIRPIETIHLLEVGNIHCEAFPRDMRSRLGAEVVAMYFEHQLAQRNDVHALGAFDENSGGLLGFCFGGIRGEHVRGWMIRHFSQIVPRLLLQPKLLRHLGLRERIGSRLSELARKDGSARANGSEAPRHYEIFSLAVKAAVRNSGIGTSLMGKQEAYARQQKCVATSLGAPVDDQNTIAFYKRIGFREVAVANQRWTGQMIKELV